MQPVATIHTGAILVCQLVGLISICHGVASLSYKINCYL